MTFNSNIFLILSSLLSLYLFELRLYSVNVQIFKRPNMIKKIQYFISTAPINSDLHEQAECLLSLLHYNTSSPKKHPPLSSNCRPPGIITAPNPGKIPSEPSEFAERKTNRLKSKALRNACVSRSQGFVCYSVSICCHRVCSTITKLTPAERFLSAPTAY